MPLPRPWNRDTVSGMPHPRQRFDPETRQLLAELTEAQEGRARHELTPEELRRQMSRLRPRLLKGPEIFRVDNMKIPVQGGSIRARALIPSKSPKGTVVYYHGGGWVSGGLDDFDSLGRCIADRTDCTFVLVEYRKAPEFRFPTAVEDAWRGLLWVDSEQGELAGRGRPIVVAGDSAGGNLAAVITQRAMAMGGPDIALQLLVYPVTDSNMNTASYLDPENQLVLNKEMMTRYWKHYVPDAVTRNDKEASPARAQDLSGLPPTVFITAEFDVLRDEAESYAWRMHASGVPVEARRFNGQIHGFFSMVGILPASMQAIDYLGDAVKRWLKNGHCDSEIQSS